MASFKLVVTLAGSEQKPLAEHVCAREQIAIGRAAGNDVVLPDVEKRISGRHARIDRAGGTCRIADLGSTNGTFLNDRKLEPNNPVEIKNGDRIAIGTYLLKFLQEEEAVERTVVLVDPSRLTTQLAEELPVLYARNAGRPPEERLKILREAIRSALRPAGPEASRAVLSQLQARFRPGEAALSRDPGTLRRQKDAELQRREELYQAGFKAFSEMSRHFVGEGQFETAAQVELFARLLGQALDVTVEWISRSLKGRKEFESQFSADLTMVFSHEKNPVKAAAGPQELAKFLVDWRSPRPPQGVKDCLESACKDLTMHQLGLLAGVQEALGAVLQRLDPKAVETEAREKGGGVFASLEKRAWKRYSEVFSEIFAENSKLFNEMIYPNVRKGYLSSHSDSGPKTPLPGSNERTMKKEGEQP